MKKILIPFILALAASAAQAAEKNVVVSVEGKGYSATMSTLMGSPMMMTSGDIQSAGNQSLCTRVDEQKVTSTLSSDLSITSGTSVAVLPVTGDEHTVRAFISFSRQEMKDPKIETIDKDCTLATGLTNTTIANQLAVFEWGVPKKMEMLNGQILTVTFTHPNVSGE